MGRLVDLGGGGRKPPLGTGDAERARQALLSRRSRLEEEEAKAMGTRKKK
jgi:hypothetical protein